MTIIESMTIEITKNARLRVIVGTGGGSTIMVV
jgi:hypothetical protein